jgi:UPF0755 protein
MRLQSDPTIIYGITKGQSTLGRGMRRSEIEAKTPYNTYQIDRLPPTPIANPGIESLQAVANPDTHELPLLRGQGRDPVRATSSPRPMPSISATSPAIAR